jgi:hypothetical protein
MKNKRLELINKIDMMIYELELFQAELMEDDKQWKK